MVQSNISLIKQLSDACTERTRVYKRAADYVKIPYLSEIFSFYSKQSDSFNHELKAASHEWDDDDESVRFHEGQGARYRGWLNVQADVKGIFYACMKTDGYIVEMYESALEEELPFALSEVVGEQLEEIRVACERIKQLMGNYLNFPQSEELY